MNYISNQKATELFSTLPPDIQAKLIQRGGNYGIPGSDLIRKIPEHLLNNPQDIESFLSIKDVSHKIARSKGGSPNSFDNWIFEDSSVNRARGNSPMGLSEEVYADMDNKLDAYLIDSLTPDPILENAAKIEDIKTIISTENLEETNRFFNSNLEEVAPASITIGYVVGRTTREAMSFLRDIDWKRFRKESQYRNYIVNNALKRFLEDGWEDLSKSIVMGFLIVGFPPLQFLFVGQGVIGLVALGVRWLLSKNIFPSKVGLAFARIGDTLEQTSSFLRKCFKFAEKIVDTIVSMVIRIAKSIGEYIKEIAQSIYNWIMNFINPNQEPKLISIEAY